MRLRQIGFEIGSGPSNKAGQPEDEKAKGRGTGHMQSKNIVPLHVTIPN